MVRKHREDVIYAVMRRNVRKQVVLPFKFYQLRVEATLTLTTQRTSVKTVLPTIQLSALKRGYIRDEILIELQKIKNVKDADLHIEVFAVYGTSNSIGEYERYLGELFFLMSEPHAYEKTKYHYKASQTYYDDPTKSDFIAKRI